MSSQIEQEVRPPLPIRIANRFREEGLGGIGRIIKKKVYRRKDMAVCVRNNKTAPLRDVRRVLIKDIRFEEASLDLLDAMAFNFPQKRDWYRERLETPGYHCSLAMRGDEVIAHNWFCTVPHSDPEMKCIIDPGEKGAYWFEGWCRESFRGKGIGALGMNECFGHLFPKYDIQTCMTLLEWDNRATRRMHKRWHFEDVGRRIHIRFGPFRWTSAIKPVPEELQTASNG